ncbi:MAG: threonine--tRNA ligase [Elusimicrobia bacterium HGW-Elusimicrobia-1]|jgi:threonyl-tRNA synthetase|nr:MAG: threonine--tRNA ligase [Elusimicrobia bacterium HGW-Elusimicrobia-1]
MNEISSDSNQAKLHLDTLRHSAAHIMAAAVTELFPGTKVAIGPSIDEGFYYDFDRAEAFTPEDLEKIESRMREIAVRDEPFVRTEKSKAEALARFESLGEKYKVELINGITDDKVSYYSTGAFTDLCRGPHIERAGAIKHFKLLSVAGAYWRGDARNPMLQRIYGTAFESEKELKKYLLKIEEAKKRDHRKLGRELGFFGVSDEVGPGLILWHPRGAMIRHIIETFWREEHYKNGYELIYSPHIGRSTLWETSGHLGFYKDAMYAPMKIDGNDYYVKPMNCPFHIEIYRSRLYSYRDLPLRWAELGTVYRYEKSGVLHGLMRVRGFTQDDAHIFCSPEQVSSEIREVLRFSMSIWKTFGFSEIKAYLATKPVDAIGPSERWAEATAALRGAVEAEGLECEIDEGGGAFYGPKIDLKVKDALGREWQTSTIQFDFNMPERFDMTFVGADGAKHRPYMIHRALFGSLERFFGILIEHHAGKFPAWLSPTQVVVANISDDNADYARSVADELRRAGFRAEADLRNEKIGYKIREATLAKVSYILVAGEKEKASSTVAVRTRAGENLGTMSVTDFLARLKDDVSRRL